VGYFNLIGNLMAGHGRAQQDSSNYGFYTVRLKESLRKEAPADTTMADSLIKHDKEQNDDDALPVVAEPVKKPSFLQRLFGKKDTITKKEETKVVDLKAKLKAEIQKLRDDEEQKELLIDTAGKTRKEIRQEKRKMRNDEKDQEKALKTAAGE